jgi:uncharacterized membrane protein (UPF0127 family)
MQRRRMLTMLSLIVTLPGEAIWRRAIAQDTTRAQAELPKEKLTITTHDGKTHDFNVEIARTPEQQTVGLMFRTVVAPDGGMLFVNGRDDTAQFWMRNTLVPLDMVFIKADGSIRHIAENAVPQSLAIIDSRGPVHATLELAAGTAERLDIRVGDKVSCAALGPS